MAIPRGLTVASEDRKHSPAHALVLNFPAAVAPLAAATSNTTHGSVLPPSTRRVTLKIQQLREDGEGDGARDHAPGSVSLGAVLPRPLALTRSTVQQLGSVPFGEHRPFASPSLGRSRLHCSSAAGGLQVGQDQRVSSLRAATPSRWGDLTLAGQTERPQPRGVSRDRSIAPFMQCQDAMPGTTSGKARNARPGI